MQVNTLNIPFNMNGRVTNIFKTDQISFNGFNRDIKDLHPPPLSFLLDTPSLQNPTLRTLHTGKDGERGGLDRVREYASEASV